MVEIFSQSFGDEEMKEESKDSFEEVNQLYVRYSDLLNNQLLICKLWHYTLEPRI